jgi:hypothetical protein
MGQRHDVRTRKKRQRRAARPRPCLNLCVVASIRELHQAFQLRIHRVHDDDSRRGRTEVFHARVFACLIKDPKSGCTVQLRVAAAWNSSRRLRAAAVRVIVSWIQDAMTARAVRRLKHEVDSWAAETRLLLEACRLLIDYFGTPSELKSWDAATKEPLRWISLVVAHFSSSGRRYRPTPLLRASRAFRCSESTARVVSPLAEIVGGPVAGFIYTIRKVVPRAEQSRHVHPYGHFSVSFADAITQPLWTRNRHLAPDEWKKAFSAAATG